MKKILRPDFSNALIHLTRSRVGKLPYHRREKVFDDESSGGQVSAFDVIKEILQDNKIYGSRPDYGYIKGGHTAVCFSEVPFSGLKYMLQDTRYEPYGLIFNKNTIFKNGGRPVIYLPDSEAEWIPSEEKWRHVRFEYGKVDFTFEREWRLRGDLDLSNAGFYILVKNATEKDGIENYFKTNSRKCAGIFVYEHMIQMF